MGKQHRKPRLKSSAMQFGLSSMHQKPSASQRRRSARVPANAGSTTTGPQILLRPDDYECTICHELLLDPVVGSCGHDFCKECLEQWRESSSEIAPGRPLCCPTCRTQLAPTFGVCRRLCGLIQALFADKVAERRAEMDKAKAEMDRAKAAEIQEQQQLPTLLPRQQAPVEVLLPNLTAIRTALSHVSERAAVYQHHRTSAPGTYQEHHASVPGMYPHHRMSAPGTYQGHHASVPGMYPHHRMSAPGTYQGHHASVPGMYPHHRMSAPGTYQGHHASVPGMYPQHRMSAPGTYPQHSISLPVTQQDGLGHVYSSTGPRPFAAFMRRSDSGVAPRQHPPAASPRTSAEGFAAQQMPPWFGDADLARNSANPLPSVFSSLTAATHGPADPRVQLPASADSGSWEDEQRFTRGLPSILMLAASSTPNGVAADRSSYGRGAALPYRHQHVQSLSSPGILLSHPYETTAVPSDGPTLPQATEAHRERLRHLLAVAHEKMAEAYEAVADAAAASGLAGSVPLLEGLAPAHAPHTLLAALRASTPATALEPGTGFDHLAAHVSMADHMAEDYEQAMRDRHLAMQEDVWGGVDEDGSLMELSPADGHQDLSHATLLPSPLASHRSAPLQMSDDGAPPTPRFTNMSRDSAQFFGPLTPSSQLSGVQPLSHSLRGSWTLGPAPFVMPSRPHGTAQESQQAHPASSTVARCLFPTSSRQLRPGNWTISNGVVHLTAGDRSGNLAGAATTTEQQEEMDMAGTAARGEPTTSESNLAARRTGHDSMSPV